MRLDLIIGPMFSGKSSALQAMVSRHEAIGWNVLVIKHSLDVRYLEPSSTENNRVINHNGQACHALARDSLLPLIGTPEYEQAQLIGIEEGQFFSDIVEFVLLAVETHGKDVVVAGLDGDAHRKPFENISRLRSLADKEERLFAFCELCGNKTPALFTLAIDSRSVVETKAGRPNVGGKNSYMPLCRKHYIDAGLNSLKGISNV